ncbi:ABC transporter permease [Pseudomonas sp. UBA4617]|uniref:ABC transporter permease n=1 Tax=Pseudomonas sp. UBA4617 TaxID=1947318 RepID=UPI0039C98078
MPEAYGPSWPQRIGEALGSLRQLGARAWLALSGIAIGCAALVALMNIGHGAAQHVQPMFQGLGSDLLVVSLEGATAPGGTLGLEAEPWPSGIRAAAPLATAVQALQVGRRGRIPPQGTRNAGCRSSRSRWRCIWVWLAGFRQAAR